jgi:hypothetical protein
MIGLLMRLWRLGWMGLGQRFTAIWFRGEKRGMSGARRGGKRKGGGQKEEGG